MGAALEQLVYVSHCEIRRDLKPDESIRWESDNQGGGRWVRFVPGETLCWSCDKSINVDGECSTDARGDFCGGAG